MAFLSELDVRQFWKDNQIFQKSKDQNKENQRFIFYDGPPFASGDPHHGHLLAGTIKDVITRYHSQLGQNVGRRWGWDTHGVPIESKINTKLGIKSKQDVEKYGLKNYNDECRKNVMSCIDKWKRVTWKLGRWIDMDDAYKTMDIDFMNSTWYVFNQLYQKNQIYHGVKIMSFSPGLNSPLSNNEANHYKKVSDPSLTLQISANVASTYLKGSWHTDDMINILVWTTTPWTLPCNLLLCVHPELEYVFIMRKSDEQYFLLAKTRLNSYFKSDTYRVIDTVKGRYLKGITYKPLFPFYNDIKTTQYNIKPFRITCDSMVSSETGTGIVHIAPGFGQEDYDVAYKYGLISDEILPPCPLDDNCHYTEPVNEMDILKNRFVKNCDKDIIMYLKQQDRVFQSGNITHDYPYCYRTNTPLIYRTYPAWFIKVKNHKDAIKANLMKTNWVPTFVRDNKYSQTLECVVDWCISRNRFWGTPIPIWSNDEGETVVVESSMQLEKLTNREPGSITDLHPEYIWDIIIPSQKPDGKPLQNVKLVLDCWFESGSMPFGQWGYPYNKDINLNDIFPADFIAEGTDQTRGWFHSLMTLYTLLIDKPPFRNLIVNGIVQSKLPQDTSGENNSNKIVKTVKKSKGWVKMSKQLGNYEDVELVMDKYGADTLRLFLIKSPGVKAGDVPFDVKTLPTVHKNCCLMFQNMLLYWKQTLNVYKMCYTKPAELFDISILNQDEMSLLDIWIIQELNHFLEAMCHNLDKYQLFPLWDVIDRMINMTSRWYIKLNKKNLKGEYGEKSMLTTISVLSYVLHHTFLMMSPLMPHMTESFYQYMKQQITDGILIYNTKLFRTESIHLEKIVRNVKLSFGNVDNLMKGMDLFIKVLEQVRQLRSEHNKPIKMPLKKMIIAYDKSEVLKQLRKLEYYLKQELNCLNVEYSNEPNEYINIIYKANLKKIGQQYHKNTKTIMAHLNTMDITEYWFDRRPIYQVKLPDDTDVTLDISYFDEFISIKDTKDPNTKITNKGKLVMATDLSATPEMENQYIINCLIREIQEMRKEKELQPTDVIKITYNCETENNMIELIEKHNTYIESTLHQNLLEFDDKKCLEPFYTSQRQFANDSKLVINFHR
jgi:isoleucyl-tRNA synthetase